MHDEKYQSSADQIFKFEKKGKNKGGNTRVMVKYSPS